MRLPTLLHLEGRVEVYLFLIYHCFMSFIFGKWEGRWGEGERSSGGKGGGEGSYGEKGGGGKGGKRRWWKVLFEPMHARP